VALVFAVVAALLLGLSDFFAARSARTTASLTVTRTAVGASLLLSPLLLLIVRSNWVGRDLMLGGLSGVFMITGLMLLYRGYSVARMGVVAPLSSLLIAGVPVVWDLVNGVTPGALASVAIAVGLVALVLTSYAPGGTGSAKQGAVLGVASGLAFGVAFALMGEVSKAAGLAPVITQRLAGFALLAVIGAVRSEPFFALNGVGGRYAVATGVPAVLAIASLQVAFQKGDSGPVAVASSQFATVAVILSVLFNRERMRWWQAVGVGATALAVAMIAAG
jgi:drug/metabolite transporter (DMT)-like permease